MVHALRAGLRHPWAGHAWRWCGRPLLVMVAALALLATTVISGQPLIDDLPPPQPADSAAARHVVAELGDTVKASGQARGIVLGQRQLDALGRLTNHGFGTLRPQVRLGSGRADLALTIVVARHSFINLEARVAERRGGFPPVSARVGAVDLSPAAMRWMVERLWHALGFPPEVGGPDDAVHSLRFTPRQQVVAVVRVPASLLDRVRTLVPGGEPGIDPALVRLYYAHLLAADLRSGVGAKPFALLVNRAFALAEERLSVGNAGEEARAAFVALGMLAVGQRVAALAGGVVDLGAACTPDPPALVLAGRQDLPKHFALSAALGVIFPDRLSRAAGEWKELNDSLPGGSGFSFVDLLANRAGLRLARITHQRSRDAEAMIRLLARAREAALFPAAATDGLAEGMSATSFRRIYRSVTDQRYRHTIARLDATLDELPLYRGIPYSDMG